MTQWQFLKKFFSKKNSLRSTLPFPSLEWTRFKKPNIMTQAFSQTTKLKMRVERTRIQEILSLKKIWDSILEIHKIATLSTQIWTNLETIAIRKKLWNWLTQDLMTTRKVPLSKNKGWIIKACQTSLTTILCRSRLGRWISRMSKQKTLIPKLRFLQLRSHKNPHKDKKRQRHQNSLTKFC